MSETTEKGVAQSNTKHVEESAGEPVASLASNASGSEGEREFSMTFGMFMAILSFQLGYISDSLMLTMLSNVLQIINQDLGPSASYIWMLTPISVTGASVSPIIGRFSDIYGRRNFLLAGNMISVIGTALGATAKNQTTVIAASTLIGIATAMRQLAWVCLGEIVPKKNRGLAFGLSAQSLSVAGAFGPVIAFAFVKNGSWRPTFWLAFALDATSGMLVFFFYRPMNQYIREEGKSSWDQIRESDFFGAFLYAAGVVVFLLGISFGGHQHPWKSAAVIVPIILGFACLVATGFFEYYARPKWAIFPVEIFKNVRGFTVLQLATFVLGMLYFSIAVLWPTQVAALYATDPMEIGWYSAATGFGGVLFAPIVGFLQLKLHYSHLQLIFYTAAMTLFTGLLATSSPTTNVSSTTLVALSYGMVAGVSVVSMTMIMVSVKHEHLGLANGTIVTMRALGGAIATTIYLTILSNKLTETIPTNVGVPLAEGGVSLTAIPGIIGALTAGDLSNPALTSLPPEVLMAAINGLKDSYAGALRLVYLVSIAFGGLGVIVVSFAANVDHLMTARIDTILLEGAHITAETDTGEGHIVRASEK